MALSRVVPAWALVVALGSACSPPPPHDRLVVRALDRVGEMRLEWEPAAVGMAGLALEAGPQGARIRAALDAPGLWSGWNAAGSWIARRAGKLAVWHFSAALPTSDPASVELTARARRLGPWRQHGKAPRYGWFYSTGGFLARGLFLALPPGERPEALGLDAVFAPSRRLVLDLAGVAAAGTPAELAGWVLHGGTHREAMMVPNRGAVAFPVRLTEGGRLRFSTARQIYPWEARAESSELAVEWRANGVWRLLERIAFPPSTAPLEEAEWIDREIDLPRSARGGVELRFRVASADGVGRLAHFVADPVVIAPRRGERPPNVLLLLVDGLRADSVGEGRPSRTPALDRLAQRGLLFANASSAAPWSRASIASMFTGRLPSAHGVETEAVISRLPAAVPTLAAELRRRGYATAAFSANPHLDPAAGLGRGFSRVESRLVDGAVLERRIGEWIERREHDPFFLVGFFMDTHAPWTDRPETAEAETIAAPVRDAQWLGRARGRARRGEAEPTADEVRKLRALYDENVRFVDARIGALLERLRASGLDRHTVVAVVADHGEAFGEHGDFFHGWNLYREFVHVPLVVAGPGVERGVREMPVSLAALPALLLELVGIGDGPLADRELARRLLSGSGAVPPPVIETRFRRADLAAIVRWPWKLVLGRGDERLELYHLERDPGERHDLAAAEPERAARLRAELLARLDRARSERVEGAAAPDADLTETLEALRSRGDL